MNDRPHRTPKTTSLTRPFSSRTGPKWYLVVMLFVALLFLALRPVSLMVPLGFLLAGAFASRLNDIGWSRWHAGWLMGWAVLAKLIVMAPVGPALSLHAKGQAFAVIGWPFLAVAVLLAVPRSQAAENRFGPLPLGWREFWQARGANRAFRKIYKRSQPAINAMMVEMRAAQENNARLSKEYLDELKRFGIDGANKKKKELDAGRAQFNAILARVTAAQAEMKPSQEAARRGQQRIGQVLAYRTRA